MRKRGKMASILAAIEALESRMMLNFDPGIAGPVQHGGGPWDPASDFDSIYYEDLRYGLEADTNGTVLSPIVPTVSAADGGQYVTDGRFHTTFRAPSGDHPIGSFTMKNVQLRDISASWFPGTTDETNPTLPGFTDVHSDGVWIENAVSTESEHQTVVALSNVDFQDVEGNEAFHWEGGSANRIWLQNLTVNNTYQAPDALTVGIKVEDGQMIDQLILDNVQLGTNGRIVFQQAFGEGESLSGPEGTHPITNYFGHIYINSGTTGLTRRQVTDAIAAALDSTGTAVYDGSGNEMPWVNSFVQNGLPSGLLDSGHGPLTATTLSGSTPLAADGFDDGGEGMAFHIERSTDPGSLPTLGTGTISGESAITGIVQKDWVDYTVDAPDSGGYLISPRILTAGGAGTFHLEFDGIWKTPEFTISTSDTSWTSLTAQSVYLPAGQHVMRLVADSGSGWDVSRFNFTLPSAQTSAPSAPTGLTAAAEPFIVVPTQEKLATRSATKWVGQVVLGWSPVSDADGYRVERSADGTTWAQVSTLLGNGDSVSIVARGPGMPDPSSPSSNKVFFSDLGVVPTNSSGSDSLQPDMDYSYRVIAFNSAGDSAPSSAISVTSGVKVVLSKPLSSPAVSATAMASGAVELSWVNVDSQVAGFKIERAVHDSASFAEIDAVAAQLGINVFIDYGNGGLAGSGLSTDLTPDTRYDYRLVAYNWLGQADDPGSVSTATIADSTTLGSPTQGTGFTFAPVAGGDIHFSWSAAGDSHRAGFLLEDSDGNPLEDHDGHQLPPIPPDATSFDLPSQSPNNADMSFRLAAFNIANYRPILSNTTIHVDNFITDDPVPQANPDSASVTATWSAGGDSVDISWTGVASEDTSDVAAYSVQRSTDNLGFIQVGLVPAVGAMGTAATYEFSDTRGIVPGETYYYRVVSFRETAAGPGYYAGAVASVSTVAVQTPFTAHTLPTRIEAEDFDFGGQDVAYSDSDSTNAGDASSYRADPLDGGVDISAAGTNYVITDFGQGEWLEYTIHVPEADAGLYMVRISASYTGSGTSAPLQLSISGVAPLGSVAQANGTGFSDLHIFNVPLSAGTHVIRLTAGTDVSGHDAPDVDYIDFVRRSSLVDGVVDIAGDTDGNDFYIKRDGSNLEIRESASNSPTPFIVPSSGVSGIAIDTGDGTDSLTIQQPSGPTSGVLDVSALAGLETMTVSTGGTVVFEVDAGDSTHRSLALAVDATAKAQFNTSQHLHSLSVSGLAQLGAVDDDNDPGDLLLALDSLSMSDYGVLDLVKYNMVIYDNSSGVESSLLTWLTNWYTFRDTDTAPGPMLEASHWDDSSFSSFGRTLAIWDNAESEFSSRFGESFSDYDQIMVMYTYFGDSNLDGMVTPTDYAAIDGWMGLGHDWVRGDVNQDGSVTPTDYSQVEGNIGAGNGSNGGPQIT